jgi:hypothetical protein
MNLAYTYNNYKQVCRSYFSDILRYIPNEVSAFNYLDQMVENQASTFAFVEVNNLMGYICLFLMCISFLGYQKKSLSVV